MKKLVVNGIIAVIWIVLFVINFSIRNNSSVLASVDKKENNTLTIMLETEVDSNEYEIATSDFWPESGYIFNAEKSACERGGVLSWDANTSKVVMESNKADKCYVYFDKYTTVKITNVTTSDITNNSITLIVEAETEGNQVDKYYYSSTDGESYIESTSNTYTFSNLEKGTEYKFKVYAVDSNGISSNVYSLKESTLELTLADICSGKSFAECIKTEVYTGDGNNGLYYHDGIGDYENASEEAGDNSYRYAGANPNNFVCFGSDVSPCPNDNLYRIIGVFSDQVKLIKSTSIGRYQWDSNNVTNWQTSPLKNTLNSTYLNSLGWWSNLIESNTTWYLGGWSTQQATSKQFYGYERGTTVYSGNPTSDIGAMGLMYPSDYGYAAEPSYWTTALDNYESATSDNWLYLDSDEWTITPSSLFSRDVFTRNNYGDLSTNFARAANAVRPVFYLKSNVALVDGIGTSSEPYRVAIA